jgi:hypothetical protein
MTGFVEFVPKFGFLLGLKLIIIFININDFIKFHKILFNQILSKAKCIPRSGCF